ncbi:asparagine synthase-related protein, partial [Enterococcus faecalis]
VESIYSKIRERLLELLSQNTVSYSEISADLSGGVDSATIIYILKALQANVKLYHANADSEWNSDSTWAKLISNDINVIFTSLPSLGSSGKNFEIDRDYSNSVLPDSPLFWADTEGYVESIEHSALTPANATHFTGLGGDELFTPMPANAW